MASLPSCSQPPSPSALTNGSSISRAAILKAAESADGIGVVLYDVSFNAIKTAVIPDPMRSRMTGAYSMVNYGIRHLGAIVGGLLGSTIGIRPTSCWPAPVEGSPSSG